MRTLAKLTWVELKLLVREPITMFFTFALPFIFLLVMGEVFGKAPATPEAFRGAAPMNYYLPAYIGMVIASIGLVGIPVHLSGYRERGVLRRLYASSVSIWSMFGSQVLVSLVISVLGSALLVIATFAAYDVKLPKEPTLVENGDRHLFQAPFSSTFFPPFSSRGLIF